MTTIEVSDAFTQEELEDITGAAEEHGAEGDQGQCQVPP